jgi:hypothetical protein
MNNFIKSQLKLNICILIGFFSLSSTSSSFKNKAWYEIKLGDLPVGLASVGASQNEDDLSSEYQIQVHNRIGVSPLLSQLNGNLTQISSDKYQLKQFFLKESHQLNQTEMSVNHLQPLPFQESDKKIENISSIFYLKPSHSEKKPNVFIPFLDSYESFDALNSKYDSDGFLKHGVLHSDGTLLFAFDRIDENKYFASNKKNRNNLIDFTLLKAVKDKKSEMENLSLLLNSCKSDLDFLHKEMLKSIPEGSYLLYRRLINITNFCKNTEADIRSKNFRDLDEGYGFLSRNMTDLLKENHKELPYAILNSPDLFLLDDSKISVIWPRIIGDLVKNSIFELRKHFELEKNRKSILGIQLDVKNLQPHAVVRARVQLISSSIQFQIERAAVSSKLIQKSFFLKGQDFAQNQKIDLEKFCSTNKGQVGIDLSDAPPIVLNSNLIRGLWDDPARLEVARQFAIAAVSARGCNQIQFRAPTHLEYALNQKLNQFKSDYLGVDNELLLSNKMQKKIWVIPGKYRLVVTSILSGTVISTHEFNVDAGTYTTVNAK